MKRRSLKGIRELLTDDLVKQSSPEENLQFSLQLLIQQTLEKVKNHEIEISKINDIEKIMNLYQMHQSLINQEKDQEEEQKTKEVLSALNDLEDGNLESVYQTLFDTYNDGNDEKNRR